MVKINKVVDEISRLSDNLSRDSHKMKRSEEKRELKKINFLRFVASYLNSFPSEEFVNGEIKRLENRKSMINQQFTSWIPSKYFEKEKEKLKEYEKEMGIPKIRMQLRALKFIINK